MNIIIDCTTTQDEFKNNGVGVYTRPLVENLIKLYPETTFKLLMFDSPSTLDTFLEGTYSNIERVSLGKHRSNNYLNPIWFNFFILPKIRMVMDKDSVYFSPYFWRGIPVKHIPSVVTIHDFALPKYNIYSQQSELHNLIREAEYWYDMKRTTKANAIITDAQFTKDDYLSYYPDYPQEKIYPIYLGIDMEMTEVDISKKLPKDWKKKGYFIYMGGGFTKNKNTHGVILSYSKLLSRLKDMGKKDLPYLVITGKNFVNKEIQDVKNLYQLIESEGLNSNVVFTGRYEDIERYSYLKNSIAALHLSFYEGFGFALVEGMLAGTPSIVHNGSCYPEVVQDGGILVDGNNYDEVAGMMLRVMEDSKFASVISKKGIKVAKQYKWEKTASETFEVFKNVYEKAKI